MGIDLKYGKIATENAEIPDDEPVFLLRGQDVLALFALEAYANAVHTAGCSAEFYDQVCRARVAFLNWQPALHHKKLPD